MIRLILKLLGLKFFFYSNKDELYWPGKRTALGIISVIFQNKHGKSEVWGRYYKRRGKR